MPSPLHKKQTIEDGIHSAVAYEYTDEAERLAATGFTSEDRNKFARVLENDKIYFLTDVVGPVWALVTSAGGGAVFGPPSTTDDAIVRWDGTDGYSVKDSGILIDDLDNMTGVTSVNGVVVEDHSGRHENGGADEINVGGLSGLLSDPQTPLDHAIEHESGGGDEIDGYQLAIVYSPVNYSPPINDILGEHLFRIDEALASSGSVSSVFGRAGDVVAESGDYNSDQVDNTSSVPGATVSDALETLNGLIVGGGGGTVSGPETTTNNAIARWSGTDGYTIKNSGIIIDDSDNITGVSSINSVVIEDHSTRHQAGGADEIDGYQLAISYSPTNYTPPVNDLLGEHIYQIDEELGVIRSSIITDHGSLTGLGDDDHNQYLLVNGSRAMSGDLDLADNDIVGIKTTTFDQEFDNGNSGTSITINWNTAQKQRLRLTADCTLSFTNPLGVGNFLLVVEQDGSGNRTIIWPSTVKSQNSFIPIFGEANSTTIFGFYYDGDGYYNCSALPYLTGPASTTIIDSLSTIFSHSTEHESGGGDEIDGYQLAIIYTPSNYAQPSSDILGEHLFRIDEAFDNYLSLGGGTMLGSINLNGNDITNIDVATNDSEHDMGNQAGSSLTLNANNGNFQRLTLTGNITSVSMTAPSAGIGRFQFKFIQDGTGGRTVTGWPGTVLWPGGTDPTLSTGINDIDIISFYWDGTNWFGVFSGDFN